MIINSCGGEEGIGGGARCCAPRRARPQVGRCSSLMTRDHTPAYLSTAASRPIGCAERRGGAKRARHAEGMWRAGNTFAPLVLETYGAVDLGAEAWFRGCIAVAEIPRPEWLDEGEEASQE